jgi:hypothetical protein
MKKLFEFIAAQGEVVREFERQLAPAFKQHKGATKH